MQSELPLWTDPEGGLVATPPGEFVQRELTRRGWSQADLAAVLQRPLPTVNEIINAKRAVTPEMSVALGKAFGTPPELWAHREAAYRLSLVNQTDADTSHRARLYEMAPLKEMQKRGWISNTDSVAELDKELCRFLKIASVDDELGIHAVARKTFKSEEFSNAQRAWLMQAARIASVMKTRSFSPKSLENGLLELRKHAMHPERARFVPVVLAEMGIRFVIVEALPKSQIDGAAFFLEDNPDHPVIVLSLRYDRMDYFWYTLSHELRHIVHGDSLSLDANIVGEFKCEHLSEIEARADKEGVEWLVPKIEMDSFILRVKPYFAKERIIQFSRRMGVHPSIVVGQLQHRRIIGWTNHRDMLEKVNGHVTSTAMTDGWGSTPVKF